MDDHAAGRIVTAALGVTDWRAAFQELATPMVNIQNAPAAPEPGAGLAALTELLGKSGVFKDITGLDATQKNVLATYLSNQENAKAFGEMAKEMAMQGHNTQNSGKIMESIAQAKGSGDLSKEDAAKLTKDHLQQQIDGGQTKKAEIDQQKQSSPTALTKAAVDAAGQGRGVTAQTSDGEGGNESVTIDAGDATESNDELAAASGVPSVVQPNGHTCWAAVASMMCMWRDPESFQTIDDVMEAAGAKFVQLYNGGRGQGHGLPMADKKEFLTALDMFSEPGGADYPLQSYIDWMKDYGPLWITIDGDEEATEYARHAIVMIRISGAGTPDGQGTSITYIDPMGAQTRTVPFLDFVKDYESLANFQTDSPPTVQVVHFKEVATDSGEGGGGAKGGAAGAAAAVGEKALDSAFDVVGEYIKRQMAAGKITSNLPKNAMFPIARSNPDDYGTPGPQQDAVKQMRITFDNLAGTGPGDGLDGYVVLQWISTKYVGPISSKTRRLTVQYLRSIQFPRTITGTAFLSIGGALSAVDIDVSLFPLRVEDKVAPPFQPIAVHISIDVEAKTSLGDSVSITKIVMLHPDDPVNYKFSYVRTPSKDIRIEALPQ